MLPFDGLGQFQMDQSKAHLSDLTFLGSSYKTDLQLSLCARKPDEACDPCDTDSARLRQVMVYILKSRSNSSKSFFPVPLEIDEAPLWSCPNHQSRAPYQRQEMSRWRILASAMESTATMSSRSTMSLRSKSWHVIQSIRIAIALLPWIMPCSLLPFWPPCPLECQPWPWPPAYPLLVLLWPPWVLHVLLSCIGNYLLRCHIVSHLC